VLSEAVPPSAGCFQWGPCVVNHETGSTEDQTLLYLRQELAQIVWKPRSRPSAICPRDRADATPLLDRTRPPPWSLEGPRSCRTRHARMGRLVQQSPPPRAHRQRAARRARSGRYHQEQADPAVVVGLHLALEVLDLAPARNTRSNRGTRYVFLVASLSRIEGKSQCRRADLNCRPHAYEAFSPCLALSRSASECTWFWLEYGSTLSPEDDSKSQVEPN
jgi:hypothetical protein